MPMGHDAGALETGSVRVGTLLALGRASGGFHTDGIWSRPSRAGDSPFDAAVGMSVGFDNWLIPKSLNVQPSANAAYRSSGSWQVGCFVSVSASSENGIRDFSSSEVDFPEQHGGGVPWRGTYQGVQR
ncbi:MAG: hypothetical protein SFV15_21575 [Polyangiaceae bacterium]|nr:hypothetical protein [Polyangiaceae bacterium]